MELVIFVGLPASGKSAFFRRRFAATHVHVSKDALGRARSRAAGERELIEAALRAGRPVVVDNTNATAAVRAELIRLGRALGARIVGYYFDADPRACLARNRRREEPARVPDVAIFGAAKKLEPPRHAEGFDVLHRVRIAGEGEFEVERQPPEETAG